MSWPNLKRVVACTFALVALALSLRAEVKVGDRFPALADLGLEGTLPELSGQVVVVDFCASWCSPCRDSFPELTKLQKAYAGRGVVVLGVSVDKSRKDYQGLLKKWAPGFPVVHDSSQKLVARVKVPTMPTSYLVDRTGVVRFIHVGFHADTPGRLRADLDSLLTP